MLAKITAKTSCDELKNLRKDQLSELLGGRKGKKEELYDEACRLVQQMKIEKAVEEEEKRISRGRELKLEQIQGKVKRAMGKLYEELERNMKRYKDEMIRFQTEVTQGFYAIQREMEYGTRVMEAATIWRVLWHTREQLRAQSEEQTLTYTEIANDWREDLQELRKELLRRDAYLPNSTCVMANVMNLYEFKAKQVKARVIEQLLKGLEEVVGQGAEFVYVDTTLW